MQLFVVISIQKWGARFSGGCYKVWIIVSNLDTATWVMSHSVECCFYKGSSEPEDSNSEAILLLHCNYVCNQDLRIIPTEWIQMFSLYVNNEFECFIRGSKHEKTVWNTSAKRECFIVFECLVPLMKHEKRVVYTTSQTKTFHWLFNLLSANGGPMKVICFCLCEQWR